jgi:phosphohistidine phosphatase SixA
MPKLSRRPRNVRVVVVRHGPAELRDPARWPDDDRRPLSGKGIAQTRKAARGIARLAAPVDRIASSPATRAAATAQLVQQSLGDATRMETWTELNSGKLAAPIFDRLRRSVRSGQEIVLIGHEPTLAEFVGMALAGDGVPVVRLAKGGAACLEFPASVGPGAGRLVWLLTRKQLADVRD